MPGGIRRRSAAAVATAALALSVLATPAPSTASAASTTGTLSAADDGERPSGEPRGTYSFLSAPDLFNGDIGDARKAATWRTGMPNSWNEHWAANVENVFGQLASFRADDYLVAGDMVEGQWHRDRWNERVFGTGLPAVTRAGNLYYGEWNRFWRQAGVSPRRVHVAVGDHEVGDNLSRRGSVKYRAFSRFKDVFAANFTKPGGRFRYGKHPRTGQHRDTAYAAWLAKDVLLVTVDVFVQRTKRTEVAVDDDQLAWVKQVLRTTKRSDTVIVQGHVPVLGPVRTIASSGLTLKGGARSDFWRTLVKEKVDLYLAGEVHADTAIQRRKGEPVQVTHGGLAAYGATKFMTGDVAPDGTITLTSRRIAKDKKASVDPERRRIWGTARTLPWKQVLRPTSDVTGRLVLSPRGRVRSSEGNLEVNSFSGRPGENPSRPRGFPEEA